MRRSILIWFIFIALPCGLSAAPVSTGFWGNIAIDGHDTVAYYHPAVRSSHQQIMGSKEYIVKWGGAEWRFASEDSAQKFSANPEQFVPRYNGHCANALSLDEGLIPTDGTVWAFFGDQLYMFYAERGRQRWLMGDWKQYKEEADQAWRELTDL